MDPEFAHELTLMAMRLVGNIPPLRWFVGQTFAAHSHVRTAVEVFGLTFPNPVGLAAGYDKDGLAWRGLSALGFGHLEVGTVTPRPQSGNPKPRIYRIPEERAVINRMGFPGRGADFLYRQLSIRKGSNDPLILGVNIGKNKDTPNQEAARDYVYLFRKFAPVANYLAVNVSSPNTVGLRRLQAREYLEDLLRQLNLARSEMPVYRPILVKIAPDLTWDELDDALNAITATGMDGIIATNTTIRRDNLVSPMGSQTGGLSGAPLTTRSREVVSEIFKRTDEKLPIVGVGGIMTPGEARAMLDAGAALVQIYTGLVYAGPGLVKELLDNAMS